MINVAVIPTLNSVENLRGTLKCVFEQDIKNVTAFVVDNGSEDGTGDLIRNLERADYPIVPVSLPVNAGVAPAWNMGIRFAQRHGVQNLFIINDDVTLRPDTFSALARCPGVLVTATNVQTEERLWKDPLGSLGVGTPGGPDFSCFLYRDAALGPFDEGFWPAYFEDNDMDYRAQLKWGADRRQFVYSACIPYIHHASGTIKSEYNTTLAQQIRTIYFPRNRAYYTAKWGGPPGFERFTSPFGG